MAKLYIQFYIKLYNFHCISTCMSLNCSGSTILIPPGRYPWEYMFYCSCKQCNRVTAKIDIGQYRVTADFEIVFPCKSSSCTTLKYSPSLNNSLPRWLATYKVYQKEQFQNASNITECTVSVP